MNEGRAILNAATGLAGVGALATVLDLQGSGYRRPGARMLVAADGHMVGGISGGCLEADALEHAMGVISDGEKRLITYDTTDPDDAWLGVGLGCEGVVRVLIEPVGSAGCRALLGAWARVLAGGEAVVQAVLVASTDGAVAVGDRALFTSDGVLYSELAHGPLGRALHPPASGSFERRTTFMETLEFGAQRFEIFWERLAPPPALWICGAGLDAPAMAELAVAQGLRVTVLDHRPAYARPERFSPEVQVVVARPGRLPAELAAAPPNAAMIMTHQYEADRAWLGALAGGSLGYLGLLGPRKRAERLLAELREDGLELPTGWPPALYAPMGLDIGAENPVEIALSALAEMRAVLAGRPGGFLRDRRAPIHGVVHVARTCPT